MDTETRTATAEPEFVVVSNVNEATPQTPLSPFGADAAALLTSRLADPLSPIEDPAVADTSAEAAGKPSVAASLPPSPPRARGGGESVLGAHRLGRLARLALGRLSGVEGRRPPPLPGPWSRSPWISALGALVCIGAMTAANDSSSGLHPTPFEVVIPSFGASAVLLYAVPQGPLSQPRNVIAGNVLSAFIGVAVRVVLVDAAGAPSWFSQALAVAASVAVMEALGVLHPPGGATALIAAGATGATRDLGFLFVVTPCLVGSVFMVLLAVAVNNADPARRYPVHW